MLYNKVDQLYVCIYLYVSIIPFYGFSAHLDHLRSLSKETWVRSLGWKDPLSWEEGMATHSSILAWRTPMDRGAWRATVHGVVKSQTQLSN